MSWGVLNAAMLIGLAGASLPVIIHLLNRRRGPVIDWGAMQFLEPGRRSRRRIRLAEILLMAARMALLAFVALALARPFWSGQASLQQGAATAAELGGPPRDVVIVLDVSSSMGRGQDGGAPLARATAWARTLVRRCRPGDTVALLLAGDRVRPVVDPPAFDLTRVDAALLAVKSARGSSDLPAALAESFRILERTRNPGRDVIILTDGQRYPWRPGEAARWALLRSLYGRLSVPPRLWSIAFPPDQTQELSNTAVGRLSVSRSLVTPGLPLEVTTSVENTGSIPFSGAAELLIDGKATGGSPKLIGPVPAGGRVPLAFRTSLTQRGSHLLAVRLLGGDSLPADDLSELPVQVTSAVPVLLVNGEPGVEPLGGETDFLRAALAPSDDDTPQFRVRVVTSGTLTSEALRDQRVVVLANVERISPAQSAALVDFAEAGGGILVAPGDRTDLAFWRDSGWLPARLGEIKGNIAARKAVAHPAPRSFTGRLMTAFAQGDVPALAEAEFFAYHVLAPLDGSAVLARFETGDPWIVERKLGRGQVLMLATAIDAEAGTLPVNPDFVPLTHEWIFHLAGGGEALEVRPGEPLIFPLETAPPAELASLTVETPGGTQAKTEVIRGAGFARARFDDTAESGIYRLSLPEPPGGFVFGAVARDDHESEMTMLEPAEAAKLAEGWPLYFDTEGETAASSLYQVERGGRHEVWRILVIAALAGLCVEIYLTRRLVRAQAAG